MPISKGRMEKNVQFVSNVITKVFCNVRRTLNTTDYIDPCATCTHMDQ